MFAAETCARAQQRESQQRRTEETDGEVPEKNDEKKEL